MKKQQTAVYAGTFDPITNGHIDIVRRGLSIFDRVHVAVVGGQGTTKDVLFPTEERVALVSEAVRGLAEPERLAVEPFEGLLVDYVRKVKGTVIIRGLRAVSDYEYEAQMAHINRHLAEDIETVFLVTSAKNSFISSSIVKNIAGNGGDVSALVPPAVVGRLKQVL